MSKPVKFGLIGAGGIAGAHLEGFLRSDKVALVGVADVNIEAARSMAGKAGCPVWTDFRVMLEEIEIEAVVLCTPPNTHPAICADLFACGIHVLCEKPLAIASADILDMMTAANKAGVVFNVASKFRFVEALGKACEIVKSGELGEVLLYENQFSMPVDMGSRWNTLPEISGGGVLMDNGPHSADIAHHFLGHLSSVLAVEGKRVQSSKVEDSVMLWLLSEDGVPGRIDLSWSYQLQRRGYVNILGSKGKLVLDWGKSELFLDEQGEWVAFGGGYDKFGTHTAQLEDFAAAVKKDKELHVTAEDGLRAVEVVEAAYRSLRSGKTESIWYSLQQQPAARAASL